MEWNIITDQNLNPFETLHIEIERLINSHYSQKASPLMQQLKPVTDEEKIIYTCLKIQILNALGDCDFALSLFSIALFEECQRLNRTKLLCKVVQQLSEDLQRHDRHNEISKFIERGKDVLNNLKKQDQFVKEVFAELTHLEGLLNWLQGNLDPAYKCWEQNLETYTLLKDKKQKAVTLHYLGVIWKLKGNIDIGIEHYHKSMVISKEIGYKNLLARTLNNIGDALLDKGDLDPAQEYFCQSLEILEDLGDERRQAIVLGNIGDINKRKGELDSAFDYCQRSLKILETCGNKKSTAIVYETMGSICFTRGELDEALSYFQKSFKLREELEHIQDLALSLDQIGLVYQAEGKYLEASEHFMKALELKRRIGNEYHIANTLYHMILLNVEINELEKAELFLNELTQLQVKLNSTTVNQQLCMAKALKLKQSGRLYDRAIAQQLFNEVIKDESIRHDLKVFAMLNLCDILLLELRMLTGAEKKVMHEVNELMKELLAIAKKQHSYSLLARAYFLESQLALLEFNFSHAETLLTQARLIAEEKGLWKLTLVMTKEQETFRRQKDLWKDLKARNASMLERLELSQLDKVMGRMTKKRIDDIVDLPYFAVEKIKLTLFKMGMKGPEVVVTEQLLFPDSQQVLGKMGLFYTLSLGQGESANIGLFGPLPIPTISDHIGVAYSFLINDPEHQDPRWKGKVYSLLVFSMPKSFANFFNNRELISQIIEKSINEVQNIDEFTLEFLVSLKCHTLGLEKNSQ